MSLMRRSQLETWLMVSCSHVAEARLANPTHPTRNVGGLGLALTQPAWVLGRVFYALG